MQWLTQNEICILYQIFVIIGVTKCTSTRYTKVLSHCINWGHHGNTGSGLFTPTVRNTRIRSRSLKHTDKIQEFQTTEIWQEFYSVSAEMIFLHAAHLLMFSADIVS